MHGALAMTGREFCDLLQIDYDDMLALRAADRQANYDAFLKELLRIPSVRSDIVKRLTGER